MSINPNNVDLITVDKLDTINLAINNYIAHCGATGKLGKATLSDLAVFLAPYTSGVYVGTVEDGAILGEPENQTLYYVGAGTYTAPDGPIILTSNLNMLIWDEVSWKSLEIPVSSIVTAQDVVYKYPDEVNYLPESSVSSAPNSNRIWFNLSYDVTDRVFDKVTFSILVKNNLNPIKIYKRVAATEVTTLYKTFTPSVLNTWNTVEYDESVEEGILFGVLSEGSPENIQFGTGLGMVGFNKDTFAQEQYLPENDIKYKVSLMSGDPTTVKEQLDFLSQGNFENASGIVYFTSKTNIFHYENETNSLDIKFHYQENNDYCAVRLPSNYSPSGRPCPLIVYSHGAGSPVTANTCNISEVWAEYWASNGFAILDCNALPNEMKRDWMHPTQAAGFGSEYSINSVFNAFNIITKRFNIDRTNVFSVATSMGGLTTNNMVGAGVIPFKATWLDAPVTGLYESAWVHPFYGDNSGTQIHMAIAFLYNFKNWSETTKTFDVLSGAYAGTYSFVTIMTDPNGQDKLNAFYQQNIDRTVGRNPFQNKRFTTSTGDALVYPCPTVISQGIGDTVNLLSTNKEFLSLIAKGGQINYFRELDTPSHGTFGSGTGVELEEIGIPGLGTTPVEIVRFFKKFM